jgi:hypothetical protein
MQPFLRRSTRDESNERRGIAAAIAEMGEGLGQLLGESLALAKAELAGEARGAAMDAAGLAAFGVLILVGYVLGCFAAGFGLSYSMGLGWAFLVIAGANLVVGGIGLAVAIARLRKRPGRLLRASRTEAAETVRELRSAAAGEASLVAPSHLAEVPHHHGVRYGSGGL